MNQTELPPLNITEMKLRLIHDKLLYDEAVKIVTEMIEAGDEATHLMPLLIKRYKENTFSPSDVPIQSLVDLYRATLNQDLLKAMDERIGLNFMQVKFQCQFLRAGVQSLEESLITELWRSWQEPRSDRDTIVLAFQDVGTQKALEMIDVIDYRLSGDLAERALDVENMTEDFRLHMRFLEDKTFLKLVQEAKTEMRKRIFPQ